MYIDAIETLDGNTHFSDGPNPLKNKIVLLMLAACSLQRELNEFRRKQDDLVRICASLLENELKHE